MQERKIYTVIDTNVLVSAMISHNENSPTVRILRALTDGRITPLYNYEILSEYAEVLNRSKFNLDSNEVVRILQYIIDNGIEVECVKSKEVFSDESDAVFYEIALSKKDSFLVTGNLRHFPKKPFVVTPAEIVNRF